MVVCGYRHFFRVYWICTVRQDKWTPLHWAARNGHKEIVVALLEGGADIEAKDDVRGCNGRRILLIKQ
jgi:hypothetical protein